MKGVDSVNQRGELKARLENMRGKQRSAKRLVSTIISSLSTPELLKSLKQYPP